MKVDLTTPLRKVVWKWAQNKVKNDGYESEIDALQEVCQHGCSGGTVGELIYYSDTISFFKKHRKEITKLLMDLLDHTGESVDIMLRGWDKTDPLALDTHNQNLLAWFGFEETAQRLLNQIENA
jgi:hypothetical protein